MGKQFDAIGFEIVIRVKDHGPPHVHAVRGRDDVKIDLEPVEVKRIRGRVNRREAVKLGRIVAEHQTELLAAWRRIYGQRQG